MISTATTNNNAIAPKEHKKINWWIFLALALAVVMVDVDMTAASYTSLHHPGFMSHLTISDTHPE